MKAVSIRLVFVSLLLTSVFSITMKRRVMLTTFPERSSTTVIKMLYQVSEYSRKTSKSGTETYVKIICLCDETRQEAEAVSEQTITDTVHSSVVRAADCRSAGPWFNSGWKSLFTSLTGYDRLTNQIIQMMNIKSPIRTVIRTITRKSVNMVAELDNDTAPSRILDTSGQRLEDYSTVAKAATAIAVALDTMARAAQRTVIQLKSELAQSQQSRTEVKTQVDSLSLIVLKPPSDFRADTVVGEYQDDSPDSR